MSNPPVVPRPPGVGSPLSKGPIPPPPVLIQGEPKKASILPLVVAAVLLVVSISLYLLRYQLGGGLGWHFLGYSLTPIFSALVLGWDAIAQRQGRKDPWFEPKPSYSRIIRVMVALGFAVAVFHILEIGTVCGQGFVQSGVFCGA